MNIVADPVIISTLGGCAVQLLYILDGLNAPKDRSPDFKSVSYYFGILLNLALSAILGYVYFDEMENFNKIVYFHIGASAPLILRTLATSVPEVVGRKRNEDV
jgi:hypothetical protein